MICTASVPILYHDSWPAGSAGELLLFPVDGHRRPLPGAVVALVLAATHRKGSTVSDMG